MWMSGPTERADMITGIVGACDCIDMVVPRFFLRQAWVFV